MRLLICIFVVLSSVSYAQVNISDYEIAGIKLELSCIDAKNIIEREGFIYEDKDAENRLFPVYKVQTIQQRVAQGLGEIRDNERVGEIPIEENFSKGEETLIIHCAAGIKNVYVEKIEYSINGKSITSADFESRLRQKYGPPGKVWTNKIDEQTVEHWLWSPGPILQNPTNLQYLFPSGVGLHYYFAPSAGYEPPTYNLDLSITDKKRAALQEQFDEAVRAEIKSQIESKHAVPSF